MRRLCSKCKAEAEDIQQTSCAQCQSKLTVELEEGDKVGSFEIISKLPEGDGGMATVYEAKLPGRTEHVALKIAGDRQYEYSALLTEADVLSELDHPSIVKIIPLSTAEDQQQVYVEKDYIEGEPKNYVALEYIDGDELVEITPRSIRMRKYLLKESDRRRSLRRVGT